ncbi:septation protein IspZ [Pseudomonas sp. SIMBA_077]
MSITKHWLFLSFGLLWRSFLLLQIYGLVFSLLTAKLLLSSASVLLIKPTLLYGSLALIIFIAQVGLKLNTLRVMFGKRLNLSQMQWQVCALSLASLFATMAVLNAAVAFFLSFDSWLYYKVFVSPVLLVVGLFAISWVAIRRDSTNP